LFHPIFQQKNFIEGIFTLLQNGYPLDFTFFVINNRLKFLFHKKKQNSDMGQNKKEFSIYFTILYVKQIADGFNLRGKKI